MAQTIANMVRRPSLDYGDIMQQAGTIEGMRLQNDGRRIANSIADVRAKAEIDEANDISQFRMAARAGDPNAVSKLKAYPEIQAKIRAAYDSMDDGGKKALAARADRIGKAAQAVSYYPEGSEERAAAWNEQLDALKASGDIDDATYKRWYDNPDDGIIDQALAVGESVSEFRKNRAAAGKADADAKKDAGKTRMDIEKMVLDYDQGYYGKNYVGTPTPEQESKKAADVAAYRKSLTDQFLGGGTPAGGKGNRLSSASGDATGPKRTDRIPGADAGGGPAPAPKPAPAPAAGGGREGFGLLGLGASPAAADQPAVPETHKNAVRVKNRAELEALAPGTPVILPDGRTTYRK